jgi:signal transduction histidine kinase
VLAEFPFAVNRSIDTAMIERFADPRSAGICRYNDTVAAPIHSGGVTVGWAAALGPGVGNDAKTETLMRLLARYASVLLCEQYDEVAARTGPQWESAARDGYLEWDLESGLMRFSRRSLALLDHSGADRPDRPDVWFDRIHPDDRAAVFTDLLTAAVDQDGGSDCEHRIVRRDGSVGRLVARMVLEHDDAARPRRLVGWLGDVSHMREVESSLSAAQSLAEVGRLAACCTHDFNNFLTIIRGHTELALGAVDPDGAAHESLELIKHAAAGASTLTRQLLSVRRRHTPVQASVDLNAVVASTERTLRALAGSSTRVVTTLAPQVVPIHADPAQIERLLINLVVNARDAMPHGGVVSIATAATTDATHVSLGSEARPLLLVAGEYVTLTVEDTGAGMDDQTRARMFEPFFTTKAAGRGTGLGLWIVRDVVERCGGGIDVQTTPGRGTRFVMYFPRAD